MKIGNFNALGFKIVNQELTLANLERVLDYLYAMKWIKKLFDFYLDASIHVALAVVSLYGVSTFFLGLKPNINLATFIGLGTIVCYNFIKYGVEAEKYLILSNRYHKVIQAFSFVSFGVSVYFALQLRIDILISITILTVISVLYALPVLPSYKNLRSLGILKIFIVALTWTGFTVFLPLQDVQAMVAWDARILMIQRFFLVLVLIIPFEIRDMHLDAPELRTVPQRLGVTGSKQFGYVLTILFFLMTFLKDDVAPIEIVSRFLVTLALLFVLFKTREKQTQYFSSFWVEGIPIFWWILLLVIERGY